MTGDKQSEGLAFALLISYMMKEFEFRQFLHPLLLSLYKNRGTAQQSCHTVPLLCKSGLNRRFLWECSLVSSSKDSPIGHFRFSWRREDSVPRKKGMCGSRLPAEIENRSHHNSNPYTYLQSWFAHLRSMYHLRRRSSGPYLATSSS